MSVLYVAANLRPVITHHMITPYVSMADGDILSNHSAVNVAEVNSGGSDPCSPFLTDMSSDENGSDYDWHPDGDLVDGRRLEAEWVKVILEKDIDFRNNSESLIRACVVAYEQMGKGLDKYHFMLERFKKSMIWEG